eukprot:2779699-Rhodomonas_salina.1
MRGKYSIRTAVKESIPSARKMTDIIAPPISLPPRRSQVAAFTRSISGLVFTQANKQGKQRIKIDSTGNNNFVALMCTLQ